MFTLFPGGRLFFNSCAYKPEKKFKVYNPDTKHTYYVEDSLYAKKLQEAHDSIHKKINVIEETFKFVDSVKSINLNIERQTKILLDSVKRMEARDNDYTLDTEKKLKRIDSLNSIHKKNLEKSRDADKILKSKYKKLNE